MTSESVDLVMLIDDSDIDLFVQKRFMEISAFAKSIMVFQSARKALDVLVTPGQAQPNLIFLDLNMPDVDGFAFLEQLAMLPVHQPRPKVVILTSSSSASDKARAATFTNVVCFLSKPLSEKRLVELRELVVGK
jgi:two-component system nitrate/nitrite response regulator NarL